MSTYLVGNPYTVTATFRDASGNPEDPALPLVFTLRRDNAIINTDTYQQPGSKITRVAKGIYAYSDTATVPGAYGWDFLPTNAAPYVDGFSVIDPTRGGWPMGYGYCAVTDVQANIPKSTWDVNNVAVFPTLAMVQQFIAQEAANIDMALAKRGYSIPLVARASYIDPATGSNVISAQAWARLQWLNAALVTARVLSSLHETQEMSEDPAAQRWLHEADDYLVRIEEGQDNLTLWGVDGPWEPDPDPSKAVHIGGYTDPNSPTGVTLPFFTRTMRF